jgi:hypothetical protein
MGHLVVAKVLGFCPIWARIWFTDSLAGWVGFNECDPADTLQVGTDATLRKDNLGSPARRGGAAGARRSMACRALVLHDKNYKYNSIL